MKATISAAVLVLAGAATVGIGRAQTPWQAARVSVEVPASEALSLAGGDTVTTQRLWSLGSQRRLMPGGQSPDGRHVAYTDWATGDLAVHDVVSQTDRRLTDKGSWTQNGAEYAEGATFSPDGQRIAYAWSNSESRIELRVVRLDGGAPRIVYRYEETAGLVGPSAWSPDGRSVLALMLHDGSFQVATISVADGTVRILKSFNRGSPFPSGPTYSPDGRWILYDFPPSEDDPQRDVFLLAADGSREVPLVQSPADDRVLGWAPDGRHVLFLSDRAGTRSAWMIGVAAGRPQGEPVLVKPDLWRSGPVGFTRDGKLYYTVETGTSGVYIATVDPASGRVAVPPALVTRQAGWPVFSPDGRSLAYVVRGPSPQPFALRIRSLESGEERTLEPRLRSLLFPRWSPDGRAMVGICADDQNRIGLYTIDMQTGAVSRLLALDPPNSWAQFPVWSRDAQTIFFVYGAGSTSSLRALNVQTGETRELYRSGVRALVGNGMTPSPDGAELAWVRSDTVTQVSELMAMPTPGGVPRVLASLRRGEEARPVAWTRDGLFYEVRTYETAGPARPAQLWLLPAGGSPVRFDLGASGLLMPWFGVHPDGRRVTYLSGDIGSELWVMENILPGLGAPGPTSPRR